jgi:hypothetical protein
MAWSKIVYFSHLAARIIAHIKSILVSDETTAPSSLLTIALVFPLFLMLLGFPASLPVGVIVFAMLLSNIIYIRSRSFIINYLDRLLFKQKDERESSRSQAVYADTIKRLSVTSLFIKDRLRDSVLSYTVLAIILIVGLFGDTFSVSGLAFDVFVLAYALIILLDGMFLAYRVRRGFYGNNESEARELIAYILRNSDKLDDGDGSRRIFDPAEPETTLAAKVIPLGLEA